MDNSVPMSEFRLLPEQRFHRAIIDDDIQMLQWLVGSKKVDDVCNRGADDNNWPSLMLAARYGRLDIANYLLEIGHENEATSTDSKGNTVPMVSAKYKHEDICLTYLEKYPHTMSEVNRDGRSAINWAAQNGLNRVIEWILSHGGNINQRDIDGNTPLHHAASWNQYSIVTLLLERDAQIGLKNHKGYTATEYAYSSSMEKHIGTTVSRLQFKRQQALQKQAGAFVTTATAMPRDSVDVMTTPPPTAVPVTEFPSKQVTLSPDHLQ
ncbi:Target of rapamycin complex 2 subunit avo2 [Kickxella alabastrina]|uniref:Target of rapamycin complex 2 subunit avo2 n=1 Tax=Kickxella alabastrina TaxID=61397 RepID=A0ACC1IK04_9FUNG|nr:Target of rapamycin complex 2 subunit avo2 [Kickxella alabastrina]